MIWEIEKVEQTNETMLTVWYKFTNTTTEEVVHSFVSFPLEVTDLKIEETALQIIDKILNPPIMAKRNKHTADTTQEKIYNNAGVAIATAAITSVPGVSMEVGKFA